jgi:sirohydrochlorin cobaltochelatase
MNSTTQRGVVLFAHGSRDPLWRAPMEAVAKHAATLDATATVACAYLELTEPDLPTVCAQMVNSGVRAITVVPMFLGVGKHAREDLPVLMTELKAAHPQVVFSLQAAVGENPAVVDLLARIAVS